MGRWQNIPPNYKPNWPDLHEGQRRYAFEQYNLARVRRNLPIDHPVPERQGEYNHRGIAESPPDSEREREDNERAVEAFDDDDGDIDPSAEEILAQLPDVSEDISQEFDESLLESDNQGPSGSSDNPMADHTPMTPAQTPKRGSEGQGGSHSKRLFGGPGGTRLPGTAQGQGGNTGGEDAVRPFQLPRPSITITANPNYYRKVHRFFTYGYAYKMFSTGENQNYLCMSSPLAQVPWDWLHFYLNPSEHALLPLQSSVQKVKCTVYQRNVRVAFNTNSSASALATLNQNKNIVYAKGLNKNYDCRPIRYKGFVADQPMIPNSYEPWKLQDMMDQSNNWYGDNANINSVVPRHQMGQPDILTHYAGLVYQFNPQGVVPQDGWECIQNFIEESDADATSGGKLCEFTYHPQVGICKKPMKKVCRRMAAGSQSLIRGSQNLEAHTTTVTLNNNGISARTSTVSRMDQNYDDMKTNVQLIEKSQMYTQGIFKVDNPQAQDSLHIGVQPTYALTSTNTSVNNSFTDTQAYFEVVAEAWIDQNIPTRRPLTGEANDTYTDYWQHNTGKFKYEVP